MVGDEEKEYEYDAVFPKREGDYDFIPRLWATKKIGYLLNEIRLHGEDKELVDEIINLSLEYGVMTHYTSFLVDLDTDLERPGVITQLRRRARESLKTEGFYDTTGVKAVGGAQATQNLQQAETIQQDAQGVKVVGTKTFYNKDGVWVDYDYKKQKTLDIAYASDAYFKLVGQNPTLGKYLALGENVTFCVGEKCFKIGHDGKTSIDDDELVVPTTIKPTTTLKPTTTTPTTTVTTTIAVACTESADCGQTHTKRVCYQGDVYEQTIIPYCSKGGTKDASCKQKATGIFQGSHQLPPLEECGEQTCADGVCGGSGSPTTPTTTAACAWTQTSCQQYCDNNCDSQSMQVSSCVLDTTTCKCTVSCVGTTTVPQTTAPTTSTPTTTPQTTAPTTSTPTTTPTTVVGCGTGLYENSNCDGDCDSECEDCVEYAGTLCYRCVDKDCSDLSGGWSSSVSCDSNHEELEYHPSCSGCYQCNEVCPEDVAGIDYYINPGCEAKCYSDLCRQVVNHEPQSQYKDCYRCYEPECGNGVLESGEECEVDADCIGYSYCDLDCECQPDCVDYCDDQGVDGYNWINDGAGGSPVITSSAQCSAWMAQKLQQISKNCFTSCAASSSYTYDSVYSCCCVDWNSLPAKTPCPCTVGVNCPVILPTEAECQATL